MNILNIYMTLRFSSYLVRSFFAGVTACTPAGMDSTSLKKKKKSDPSMTHPLTEEIRRKENLIFCIKHAQCHALKSGRKNSAESYIFTYIRYLLSLFEVFHHPKTFCLFTILSERTFLNGLRPLDPTVHVMKTDVQKARVLEDLVY